jgi:hypothetical protein
VGHHGTKTFQPLQISCVANQERTHHLPRWKSFSQGYSYGYPYFSFFFHGTSRSRVLKSNHTEAEIPNPILPTSDDGISVVEGVRQGRARGGCTATTCDRALGRQEKYRSGECPVSARVGSINDGFGINVDDCEWVEMFYCNSHCVVEKVRLSSFYVDFILRFSDPTLVSAKFRGPTVDQKLEYLFSLVNTVELLAQIVMLFSCKCSRRSRFLMHWCQEQDVSLRKLL